ncbi:MAG: hypothetical protein ACO1RA_16025 [Planctomycetaceae bacterium]
MMTPKAFDRLAKELFAPVLGPLGFSCEKSDRCSFYRPLGNGLWHVIIPDLGSRGVWYDVKVFPSSEEIEVLFEEKFPDSLGIPTDSYCYLSERGIGVDQTQFNCKTEENYRARFQNTVKGLLTSIAVPYLDRFRSLGDVLPEIRNPLYRAIGEFRIKGLAGSRNMLLQQKDRLANAPSDPNVDAAKKLLESLLAS